MTATGLRVHVVPHVHWDREWYRTQPELAERLAPLLVEVVEQLESGELPHLLFDGQVAAVLDWLEGFPEPEREGWRARVRSLVGDGRLALGPWFVPADEALVGAELQQRNLTEGLAAGAELGGCQRVGWLAHASGHVAGMPSLLARHGVTTAVVWRGVPPGLEGPRFTWRSPDGAEIAATWLTAGCDDGTAGGDDVRARVQRLLDAHPLGGDALLLLGGDHPGSTGLPDRVREIAATPGVSAVRVGSLAAFLTSAHEPEAPVLQAELRDPRVASMAAGALSARGHLKLRQDTCERLLFSSLEPAAKLDSFRAASEQRIRRLVRLLLLNASHRSIWGCSVDAVHRAMEVRYDEVEAVGGHLLERTLRSLAAAARDPEVGPTAGVVLFRTAAASGPTELAFLVQGFDAWPRLPGIESLGGERVQILSVVPEPTLPESGPGADALRVRALVDTAPATGISRIALRVADAPLSHPKTLAGKELQRRRDFVLARGGPTLKWRRATGLVLEAAEWPAPAAGVGRFEDLGDRGDLHDFCPVEGERPRIFDPRHMKPARFTEGELCCELRLEGSLGLPAGLLADRTAREKKRIPVPAAVTLATRAGEPFVRVTVELTNTAKDHRLRVLFPFPGFARRVVAGMPFFPAERPARIPHGDRAAAGPGGQPAADTHPFHGFVDVSDGRTGLAVFARGLREYEVLPEKNQWLVALTLVRSVGWLSRTDLATRPGAAGPAIETPEAQCLRDFRFELALFPHARVSVEEIAAVAERFLSPASCVQV